MLKIRLQRTGRKHEPTFRIVLTDSKNSTKSGKFKEVLGSYDPRKEESNTIINKERVSHWLSHGVQATGTVHNLLVSHKMIDAKKINVLPKKTVTKKEEPAVEAPAPQQEKAEDKSEEKVEEKLEEKAVPVEAETPIETPAETPASEPVAQPVDQPIAEEQTQPAEPTEPVADEAKG